MEQEKPVHFEVVSPEANKCAVTRKLEEELDRNGLQCDNIKNKAEKRLVLKQDLLILPLLAISTFFGYLVRRPGYDPLVEPVSNVVLCGRTAVRLVMPV